MITQIRMSGFKSLVDVTVGLEPVTVLIGKSGTGKSNFMDALRFLRNCLLFRNPMQAVQKDGGVAILSATKQASKKLEFQVQFELEAEGDKYEYVVLDPVQQAKAEYLKCRGEYLFHCDSNKWIVPPKVLNPPQPAGQLMLGSIPGLQESTIAYSMLAYGIGCHRFPDEVLRLPSQISTKNGLDDGAENFLAAFGDVVRDLKHYRSINQLTAALRVIKPTLKTITINQPETNAITTAHELANLPLLTFNITQESEGFRRLFACLLALYQRPPKQMLLFDEPEKGIYPAGLSVLADEFQNCSDQGRGQVIFTTHSPDFLDHFKPEQIRVVEMKNYETKIGPVAEEQISALREQFLSPGELLTVDYARIAEPVTGG